MATVINNDYSGMLESELSSRIQMGASDMDHFHIDISKSSKSKFGYITTQSTPQDLTNVGMCALAASGGGTLTYMNIDLHTIGDRIDECRDAFYDTEFANARGGYSQQVIDPKLVKGYTESMVSDFQLYLQNLRWSGDTASTNPKLNTHDGIIKQIKAIGAYDATGNPEGYQLVGGSTPPPITPSNVVESISQVIMSLPQKVRKTKGFKVLVGGVVSSALETAAMLQVGVNNLVLRNGNADTGLITDNFFGYSVYHTHGLDAVTANESIIMAGVFNDTKYGVLKLGVNQPSNQDDIVIKDLENDTTSFRVFASQNVTVLPNLNQMAMND